MDFGGGWTDVPPYTFDHGGCVCNVAISLRAQARLVEDPEDEGDESGIPDVQPAIVSAALRRKRVDGVRVSLSSAFPVGAGLGGSSAAGVAIMGALTTWTDGEPDPQRIAEESRAVEVEELGIAGGRQDHYAAAFGGALELHFEGDHTRVERIPLDPDLAEKVTGRVIVAYTGQSRVSADMITAVLDAYRDGNQRVVGALARMKQLAMMQSRALRAGDIDELGALVGEHWNFQRQLHEGITTSLLEEITARAMKAGALGVKALGASGGGCVMAIAADGREGEVRSTLNELARVLDYEISLSGIEIVESDGHGDTRGMKEKSEAS
jgi:D-glycero-alpha-D-manno-heptose-7-phosphate kinase